MLSREKRAVSALAIIYAVRMLGLFMLIPVMVLYAGHFPDATAPLIGIAVGIYGCTQALLQIPFGILSDRWDRRLVITLGLLIFMLGSVLAAYAETIVVLIAGRALQGAGAVAAAILALVADSTRESQRSLAMAAIGGSIGAAFITALVIGPVIYSWIGGRGLFLFTALMAVLAIIVLWWVLPAVANDDAQKSKSFESSRSTFSFSLLIDRRFIGLNAGIFSIHAVLTASFIAVPLLLRDQFKMATGQHWWLYLIVMGSSLVIMLPGLLWAERKGRGGQFLLLAALFSMSSLLVLGLLEPEFYSVVSALIFFFVGFNALEAVLPSFTSRRAPSKHRGAVMGIFSTCQFAGIFFGGLFGGLILEYWGLQAIFICSSGIIATWLLIMILFSDIDQDTSAAFSIKLAGDSES
ncbi:MAG: MFS transporter [Gammaproteobacteria bacterium]|nr:MFS transporter [Gammaproteobacteria bacterium]